MVPLARALRDRRHDVLWAVPADGVDHVERTGIRAVASGPPRLTRLADIRARYPQFDALPPGEVPDFMFGKIFGATVAPPMLAALLPVALDWSPDLVVADAAEFAGHIVAAELGIPSVTKGFGPLLPERRVAAAGEEVAPLWRSRGLDPHPYGGCYDYLYLDIYPPELENRVASHVPRRQLLRPIADDGLLETSTPPPLPAGRSTAPLVYVTMGTVFNEDPTTFQLVLGALSGLDVRVLVTVGPHADPSALGPQPEHVRVGTLRTPGPRVVSLRRRRIARWVRNGASDACRGSPATVPTAGCGPIPQRRRHRGSGRGALAITGRGNCRRGT